MPDELKQGAGCRETPEDTGRRWMEKLMLVPLASKTPSHPPLAHNLLSRFMSALLHALYPGPVLFHCWMTKTGAWTTQSPCNLLCPTISEWCRVKRTSADLQHNYAPNSMNQYPGWEILLLLLGTSVGFMILFLMKSSSSLYSLMDWDNQATKLLFYPLGKIRVYAQQLTVNINTPGQPWLGSMEHKEDLDTGSAALIRIVSQLRSTLQWRLMAQNIALGLHKEKLQSSVFDSSPIKLSGKGETGLASKPWPCSRLVNKWLELAVTQQLQHPALESLTRSRLTLHLLPAPAAGAIPGEESETAQWAAGHTTA